MKLPGLDLLCNGLVVACAIRRELSRMSMDALVLGARWNDGVEAVREKVAASVGVALTEESWQRGKIEAWRMYADECGGQWPVAPEEAV